MSLDEFLSKDEVLGGLPAKRARALLFLIENRVGLLKARSDRTMDPFFSQETAQDMDMAFLEAFSIGREPPVQPSIRELERFAPFWAHLVPDNPRVRAALAHSTSEKYAFKYSDVPRMRDAIGLDQEVVQRTFQNLYKHPISSIYHSSTRIQEKLHWLLSKLSDLVESFPPFWTAFSLTLTETVGAGVLALPIALAKVGPLVGVFILVALGLVNVATIGFMSESIVRSGKIRYGAAYLGQVMGDYLGPAGSTVLTSGLGILCFLFIQAYYIGFSITLAEATGIPQWLFMAVLFGLGIYYITRKSLASTVASALAVGAVNIGIILFISFMAFRQFNPEFYNINKLHSLNFDPSLLELIFGVILAAYCGHLSICNCGRVVLQRDPGGRSLIRGSMTSMIFTIIIYSIWVLAINGTVEPGTLAGLHGTAFTPLTRSIGPIIHVLGSIFVILGMGMASVHFSLGLFNAVGERLPAPRGKIIILPRRNSRIIFHQRGRFADTESRIGLTYLGLKGPTPRFLLERQSKEGIHRREIVSDGALDLERILEPLWGYEAKKITLSLEVLETQAEFVRLQYHTPMAVNFEGDFEQIGSSINQILDLSEFEWNLLNQILRRGEVSIDQVVTFMEVSQDLAREELKKLADKGFIVEAQQGAKTVFRPLLKARRTRGLPDQIWKTVEGRDQVSEDRKRDLRPSGISSTALSWIKFFLLGDRGRLALRISPIAIAFLLTEWMLYTGKGSFSWVLNFVGMMVIPLLSGIFPVLLIASSRRKGEYTPQKFLRFFGSPVILVFLYIFFLSSLFIYGLFILREPWARAAVLLVGTFIPILTIWIAKNHGFVRRLVVEVRWTEEKGGRNLFRIMSGGKPLEAEINLSYNGRQKNLRSSEGFIENAEELRSATFSIPAHEARELKVLAHNVRSDSSSFPLGGILELNMNGKIRRLDLKLINGCLLIPIECNPFQMTFLFHKPSGVL